LDFYQKASEFLGRFTAELDRTGLTIDIEEIDHLCLRVSSLSEYEAWKTEFSDLGTLLTESYINGRPIAVFKLHIPVKSGNFWVDLIELPAPKSGRSYNFGFEHIEAVSKFPLENLLARRSDLPFLLENFNAPINRDIQLRLDSGLIKFHDQSLEEIIVNESFANEKNRLKWLGIFDFDDTLVKSKLEFLESSRAALSEFLKREVSTDECLEKARQTFPEFFANFNINSHDEIQSVLRIFRDKWQAVGTSMVLPEGIHTLLSCLHSEGVELVVWTARDFDTTRACLEYLKIDHFFTKVFAFDPVTGSKPMPPPELEPLTKNRRVALIGDSITDQIAAQNIGAAFYQATWIQKQAINVNADAICESSLICLERMLSFFHRK
jgi:predicted metalloenzyme YecM/phosphoglycolate phosphatase-like HAD superfamily hydrolase